MSGIGTSLLVIVLVGIAFIFFSKRRKGKKKYPEYPSIDDEYVDALKELADKKVNRRFLTSGPM